MMLHPKQKKPQRIGWGLPVQLGAQTYPELMHGTGSGISKW